MLRNPTITTLTVLGLALPVALLLLRLSGNWFPADPMDCTPVTTHLESLDNYARLPAQPTLVLGARAAMNWPAHRDQLGGRPVLVRAQRGLNTEVTTNCFTRVIGHYRPAHVVLLLGDAELNKLETELAEELRYLSERLSRLNTDTTLLVAGLLRTPARDNDRVDRLNLAIATEARRLPRVTFTDPNPVLADAAGRPEARRFWPDGNTLGVASYDDLADLIDARLEAQKATSNGV